MLQLIRRGDTHLPVIVMTAFGTVENAVEAMKAGAADFLLKPFSLDQLIAVVSKALEIRNLREENRELKKSWGASTAGTTLWAAARRCSRFSRRSCGWRRRGQRFCWRAKAVWAKT